MFNRVAVLGAGSWGMAIARLLATNGAGVTLWEFDVSEFRRLQEHRGIPDKLADFRLPDEIALTNELPEAVAGADLIVMAVPSQVQRSVLSKLPGLLQERVGIVNLAKGVETTTLKRMSQVIREELDHPPELIATLSGPSHAEEVVRDMPTTVVAASSGAEFAVALQELFSTSNFRVYRSDDVIGVELGGALKNIIAIAVGIADGLGMGDNTRGALITRGLAEIARLGVALGARPETFAGLSGIGDLVTTCTSRHSRNRHVGEKIGQGLKLTEVLEQMTMVAEGVETTRSGYRLAADQGVEVPITVQIHQVLFEDKPPSLAVGELMERKLKAEIW